MHLRKRRCNFDAFLFTHFYIKFFLLLKVRSGFKEQIFGTTTIYAPTVCALSSTCRNKKMTLQVGKVKFRKCSRRSKFDVGVDIVVRMCNSFGHLKTAYEMLEGMEFVVR